MIKKRKGIMIAELVTGLIFLVVFILITTSMYVNIAKINFLNGIYQTMETTLMTKLNSIQNESYENCEASTETVGNYQISTLCTELDNPEEFYTDEEITEGDPPITYITRTYYKKIIKIVKITVTYQNNGINESYSISTLKIGPLVEDREVQM